ncbi:hypothetical protein GGR51DRAFT_519641 [Nemania sp. FL0031]|nr:hypothetical protein GGR51DRAFT_519641 [Nemania sp. FL0031]
MTIDKAAEIWHNWVHWPPDGPRREIDVNDGGLHATFLDFAIGTLYHETDTIEEDDDQWWTCLETNGILKHGVIIIWEALSLIYLDLCAALRLELERWCLHLFVDTIVAGSVWPCGWLTTKTAYVDMW